MNIIIPLLRMKSWVKNGFLLLPSVFALRLLDLENMLQLIWGVLVFCFVSSFIYINNDIQDAAKDALHPRKKYRPIASGKITPWYAFLVSLALLIAGTIIFLWAALPLPFLYIVLGYAVLNLLYIFWLKNVALLELFIVAINFVLRVLAGCAILQVTPSDWILVVTFFLAFLMVVVKRKSEIQQLAQKAQAHRAVLAAYSVSFLNTLSYISATITITAYLLYSIDPKVTATLGTSGLVYSSLFVFLGIIRLIQISEQQLHGGEGDPTTLLFKDYVLLGSVITWVVYLILMLYAF